MLIIYKVKYRLFAKLLEIKSNHTSELVPMKGILVGECNIVVGALLFNKCDLSVAINIFNEH